MKRKECKGNEGKKKREGGIEGRGENKELEE